MKYPSLIQALHKEQLVGSNKDTSMTVQEIQQI